jgi:hypothetical protein
MLSQVDWRKVATGGGVLLLHILLLLALLQVTGIVPIIGEKVPKEIVLTLAPPPRPNTTREPQPPAVLPIPFAVAPRTEPNPITAAPEKKNSSEPQGDIRDLGRYLANCTGAYYEQLSPADRKNCLLFKNTHNGDNAPLLGENKASPFDQVIKERNTPAQSPFVQCDPASINASLHNVPCTNFSGGHNLLEENPGH